LAKGLFGYGSLAPPSIWAPPSATWRLNGSNARGGPKRHLTRGSWQKVQLAMAAQPPRGARVALASALAAPTRGADPSATWQLDLGKRHD